MNPMIIPAAITAAGSVAGGLLSKPNDLNTLIGRLIG